jgi:hypothetical protein
MCGRAEWERLVRKVDEAIDEGSVRDYVEDVAARIEALIDDMIGHACAPEDAELVRKPRRSRAMRVL